MKEKYYVTAPNIEHIHTIYNIETAVDKANAIDGEVWTFASLISCPASFY